MTLRNAAAVMLLGAIVAMFALELALLSHEFSIAYVARNSSTFTPLT